MVQRVSPRGGVRGRRPRGQPLREREVMRREPLDPDGLGWFIGAGAQPRPPTGDGGAATTTTVVTGLASMPSK
jgi:hypothetical protein